ncbi:MAG TPA: Smr/MutS family protein, partial [Vicinamibacteria bacterium]|nr:Smr/MutS family protein [Vicinamibacteria bacterium]
MNAHALRNLEFEKIRTLLVQQAGSVRGRERLLALRPSVDLGAVREGLGLTTEGVRLLAALGKQPYHDLPDIADVLPRARVAGLHLEPAELMDVASFIEGGVEITYRAARVEGAPRLAARAAEVRDTTEVAAAIRRAILPSGGVADDASPRLAELRRTLLRLRSQLTTVMESYLRDQAADRLLQDKVVTTRNDRFVLLVKTDHKGLLPGVIHGSSGSGQSVFVEPLPAVSLNNDIVELQDEERREVVRILTELTSRVGARAEDLALAVLVLGDLDAAQAKALIARDMDALEPEVGEALELDLPEARHPLLMPELLARLGEDVRGRRAPVPVSLRLGYGEPVLVISGPNTGGKTVALKTLGLFALMAQSGMHVPAATGARLPVFRSVYADIGDEQSIASSLSTFSAHLAAIVEMTREMESPALVLLDEVGAGTDPTEGGALGVAIVDHFRKRGAMVAATTHHGLMKGYAQATPGVASGSFGYDPHTYEPTYRLSLGVPGRSLALEMAERLGLPASVVQDARARRDLKEAQAEDLLVKLEREKADLDVQRRRTEAERVEVESLLAAQRKAEKDLAQRKRTDLEAFARELKRRGEEAARQAEGAIKDAVKRVEEARRAVSTEAAAAREQVATAIRSAADTALSDMDAPEVEEVELRAAPLAVGLRVRVKSLGVIGEVMALPTGGPAEVAVGGKRLRVPRGELVPLVGGPTPPKPGRGLASASSPRLRSGGGGIRIDARAAAPAEINLVGLTVDEALPRVDKLLDEATVTGRSQVRVIHGFGQGKLKKAVAGLLEGHPQVAS